MKNQDSKIVLLDYDGYVAKSFYASISKDNTTGDNPLDILFDLENSAIERAREFYGQDNIRVVRAISGHTFKKDIFPSYKNKRKKDEKLGEFRDYIKSNIEVTIANNLEADDIMTMINDYYNQELVVFSDDKDLRYYNPICCRINPQECIISTPEDIMIENAAIQGITGDSIDNIKGIKGRGKVWAIKYLDKNGYSLKSVIQAYKDNNVDMDECFRNLVEVMPIKSLFLPEDYKDGYVELVESLIKNNQCDYASQMRVIEGFMRYVTSNIKEVYNNVSKS